MSEETPDRVEHHFHNPTPGQVHKALYQFLRDSDVTEDKIRAIVDQKIDQAVSKAVSQFLASPRFESVVIGAVAAFVLAEKKHYEGGTFPLTRRLVYLIEQRMGAALLSEYQVSVTKKTETASE